MFLTLGIILATTIGNVFDNLNLYDDLIENYDNTPVHERLTDIMLELRGIPTGEELLYQLVGEFEATSYFSEKLGSDFHQRFLQIEQEYQHYLTTPNRSHVASLLENMIELVTKPTVYESINDYTQPMLRLLSHVHGQLNHSLDSLKSRYEILGEISGILFYFDALEHSHVLNTDTEDRMDEHQDALITAYANFIFTQDPEDLLMASYYIEQLQADISGLYQNR